MPNLYFLLLCVIMLGTSGVAHATDAPPELAGTAWSLLPPLAAIVIAIITRQVMPALFLGVWLGAWAITDFAFSSIFSSLLAVVDTHLLHALAPKDGSSDHMAIALFTLLTGGAIGIISKNGGMGGIVTHMNRFAQTRQRGQASAALMGVMIFFDDYANTLIVGNTMRPLMDRLKVSREKLAYIVDSTSAPLACIAMVTTWIGFQLSLIAGTISQLDGYNGHAYGLMLNSIPYSFYPILTLVMVALTIATRRDFGAMLRAEKAALTRTTPQTTTSNSPLPKEGLAINAILPIITLIGVTMAGLAFTGEGDSVADILGSSNPLAAMMWASLCSLIVAIFCSIATHALSFQQCMEAMEEGFTPMLLAVIILSFAWAIADINQTLDTASYILSLMGDSLPAYALPSVVFLTAFATAFATGTSWGTMGILIPIVLPLAWHMVNPDGALAAPITVLYGAMASILAGAVWGDHCSPISDTTILSSMASGCDHIAHVRTQMPYAMLVGGISLICGTLPAGFGMPWWVGLLLGSACIFIILRLIGQRADG